MDITTNTILIITGISLLALLVNIPLGYLRSKQKKFSVMWIVYIHLAIPIIIALRLSLDVSNYVIPIFVITSILGQVIGARRNPNRIS